MGKVVSLRPSQFELEQAWKAYDAAQRRAYCLYEDISSKESDRFEACLTAIRLHKEFVRAFERASR